MKKIKMLRSVSGAPDGLVTLSYFKDMIYPTSTHPITDFLYNVFVNQLKAAVDYVEPAAVARHKAKVERKMEKAAPQNKAISSAPENKVPEKKKLTEKDFKELGAGQVRGKALGAGVDLSDKPANTSAKILVEVFLGRQ